MTPERSGAVPSHFSGDIANGQPDFFAYSPKEAFGKAKWMTEAAVGRFDHLALAGVILTGLQAVDHGGEWTAVGNRILSTASEYINRSGVLTKTLFPDTGDATPLPTDVGFAKNLVAIFGERFPGDSPEHPDPGARQRQTAARRFPSFTAATSTYPDIAEYCISFARFAPPYLRGRDGRPVHGVVAHSSSALLGKVVELSGRGGQESIQAWDTRHGDLRQTFMLFDPSNHEGFHHPDDIVRTLTAYDGSCPFPELRIWDRQFPNGESFSRILSDDVQSADAFGRRVLNFCAGLPKGDILYQRIAEVLFFTPTLRAIPHAYGLGGFTEASARVLLFQKWLTYRLYSPAFGGPVPEGMDRAVVAAVDRFTDPGIWQTMRMMSDAVEAETYSLSTAHGLLAIHGDTLPAAPELDTILPSEAYEGYPFYEEPTTARVITDVLHAHVPELRRSWDTRFPAGSRIRQYLSRIIEPAFEHDFRQQQRELFADSLAEWAGERFTGNLNRNRSRVGDTVASLWADIAANTAFYPDTRTVHTITFSPGSLPEILGLRSVELVVDPLDGQKRPTGIAYRLLTKEAEFPLTGRFMGGWQRPETAGDTDESRPAVLFGDLIALAGVRDLEARVAIERTPQKETVGSAGEPGVRRKPTGKREPKPATTLPLVRHIFVGQSPDAVGRIDVTSEDLVTGIEETIAEVAGKPYTPRGVPMHPRHLPGWEAFRIAIAELGTAYRDAVARGADPAEITAAAAAIEARVGRFGAHAKKEFPQSIIAQFDTIPHPVTNEPIYLSTLVDRYDSPKLSEEERADIRLRYARRYQGQAAALSFVDSLKSWMVTDSEGAASAPAEGSVISP